MKKIKVRDKGALVLFFTFIALCCVIFFYTTSIVASVSWADEDYTFIMRYPIQDRIKHAEENNQQNDLIQAVLDHDYAQVEKLIRSRRFSVDFQDETGSTALFYAAGNGDYAIVQLLLRLGANPNLADDNNDTPLHPAIDNNFYNVVEVLLQHQADLYYKNNQGRDPLSFVSNAAMKSIISIQRK